MKTIIGEIIEVMRSHSTGVRPLIIGGKDENCRVE